MTPEIRITAGITELHRIAACLFAEAAQASVKRKGFFTVALSGGRTPSGLYALLGEDPSLKEAVPWEQIRFFWSDERCVPPDHADNNYRMASEAMLSKVPVPPSNIFRIRGEDTDPSAAAAEYEETTRNALCPDMLDAPSFDLILLGMGTDGHTASLFPGSETLSEQGRLVVAAWVERLKTCRITFTLPLINAARHVIFLVSGDDKAEALQKVLEAPPDVEPLPAALVRPVHGKLTWVVDRAAARLLKSGVPQTA